MSLCMKKISTSVANASVKVIDLSSDDEDTIQDKKSSERLCQSGLAVKQGLSQSFQDQEIVRLMNRHVVQSQALSRSDNRSFESNLQDTGPDLMHTCQQDELLPGLNKAQVQNRIKQVDLRHTDGLDDMGHPSFLSLSDEDELPADLTQNKRDLIRSKHALQGNCKMSDLQSSCSSQLFEKIQSKMDLTGPLQGSDLNYQKPPNIGEGISTVSSSTSNHSGIPTKKNGFHQFWKAGDYDVQVAQKRSIPGGMYHVRVHPKFLHSNATSHKWAFGAIAELLDNAVDEIQNGASFVIVDKIQNPQDKSPALLFQDNGGGMDPDCIRRCMSLGYSVKNKKTTIGQYGNGFKTSTMRLGADVIVFSRSVHGSPSTQSIGLLSYTFLRRTGQDDTVVPMVDFELPLDLGEPKMLIRSTKDDWLKNLTTILQWSPYKTENELMEQFEDIGPHGTKIVIFNLWLNDDGILELDFDKDKEDIRLRDGGNPEKPMYSQKALIQSSISYRLRYSLRVYASILYLKKQPNFEIILRGKCVEHHSIADDLKFSKVITYKPQLGIGGKEVSVATTIGFAEEAPIVNIHGFNVYHKNRLIMPFWKIWPSNTNSRGRGVVGVLEANFIEPAHDKQDFERTATLLRLESRLKQMTADYWRLHCELIGYQATNKSTTDNQQNLLASPSSVGNPRSLASAMSRGSLSQNSSSHSVPALRGSLSQNSVSHSMPGLKVSDAYVQTAQSIGPSGHNKEMLVETSTVCLEKSDISHLGGRLGPQKALSAKALATSYSNPVEEKPDSTVLSATISRGQSTEPSELGVDTIHSLSEESLIPDPGLESFVHDNQQRPAAFDEQCDKASNVDANCSPLDKTKRKPSQVLPNCEDLKKQRKCEEATLSGTLKEQIVAMSSQLKDFNSRGCNNSQATTISLSVEKLSEQNIQLFMRCEQYRQSERQLNQMLTRLENELRNARNKVALLASNVEIQKKHREKV
eukprot:Gb_17013 [translate_table: standard]